MLYNLALESIMKKPQLIVFASGSKEGGGSGFENLVRATRSNPRVLNADIVAVVSNHENGGVRERADRLSIPFEHFPLPREAEDYKRIVEKYSNPWVALSGWLKLARGLDPKRTINVHPGPLPEFGGDGMYGHHVHEAVIAAFGNEEVKYSAVSMHFVTEKYDEGPMVFQFPVPIYAGDTAETLAARVNAAEHCWQPYIINLIVNEIISWTGVSGDPVIFPKKTIYPFRVGQ